MLDDQATIMNLIAINSSYFPNKMKYFFKWIFKKYFKFSSSIAIVRWNTIGDFGAWGTASKPQLHLRRWNKESLYKVKLIFWMVKSSKFSTTSPKLCKENTILLSYHCKNEILKTGKYLKMCHKNSLCHVSV